MTPKGQRSGIPLWIKLAYTAFFVAWVPVILASYGPRNFLWLCNICNFLLLIGLWRESRLLISSQLLAVLLTDIAWNIDVIGWTLGGAFPLGFATYMADPQIPVIARAASIYHLFMPLILVYSVWRLGYDRRGFWLQTAITASVLPVSLLLSPPEWNINWVWGPGFVQHWLPPWLWVLLAIVGYPLVLYLPVHGAILLLRGWRRRRGR